MAALLAANDYEVVTFREWTVRACGPDPWVEQFPVGWLCDPPRRFTADLFNPAAFVEVSIEGNAHSIGDRRRVYDVKRRQAIEAAGVRIVTVLPEQVTKDEGREALAIIRRALGEKA